MGKYVPEKGTYDYDLSKTVPDIRKIMPKCEKCSLISVCCGGCPIRNFSTTGKITDIDAWQCEVRKKLICKILVQMYNESQQIKERAIEF
jgi:sulfatase maturation enzyme AslB (radical SAM superfamily)